MIAYRAQQVDTPTKPQQQQKTNANIAEKENLQHNSQALQSFIFLSPFAKAQTPTLSQRHWTQAASMKYQQICNLLSRKLLARIL
jgi:ADP-heptose:LPS heptosyltransferase